VKIYYHTVFFFPWVMINGPCCQVFKGLRPWGNFWNRLGLLVTTTG